MEKPNAPRWFIRKLGQIDPTLRVAWIRPGEWGIYQIVKYAKYLGRWNGMILNKIVNRMNLITVYSSIGGRILSDIRRYNGANFTGKFGYDNFCKEHNITY